MKKQNGREHKGRRDLILISACVLLAVFLLAAQRLLQKSGSWAVVRQEGRELGRYPLSQDAQIPLHTAEGYNLLVIEAGQAYIREADCPNGLCIQEGRVSRTGESLVCLPHRLTVTIEGGEEALDGVSG